MFSFPAKELVPFPTTHLKGMGDSYFYNILRKRR
jgi:hypothetical protein